MKRRSLKTLLIDRGHEVHYNVKERHLKQSNGLKPSSWAFDDGEVR
jgi:hypothetical protein